MSQESPWVRLPDDLYDRLKARARWMGMSMQALLSIALDPDRAPLRIPEPRQPATRCAICCQFLAVDARSTSVMCDECRIAAEASAPNQFVRCPCCPTGCRRTFLWRKIQRCGCPALTALGPPA